ncbi:hypothetical protein DFP72DRAFT_944494 [Ephemerocybe angulata]|uniref:Transmembrane protein n=1 Tax=Ephemerocybe angulata TaxID=980116 RepID=A0A8H6LRU2_9AGAR|nr:hypothetical protein DFP72DRAFT_944494 [Tulosesus angulatus]
MLQCVCRALASRDVCCSFTTVTLLRGSGGRLVEEVWWVVVAVPCCVRSVALVLSIVRGIVFLSSFAWVFFVVLGSLLYARSVVHRELVLYCSSYAPLSFVLASSGSPIFVRFPVSLLALHSLDPILCVIHRPPRLNVGRFLPCVFSS